MLKNREILKDLIYLLTLPETIILYGARQVGKTSIIKLLMNYVKENLHGSVFFADMEDDLMRKLFNGRVNDILDYFRAVGLKEYSYIFIDEIQYLDNPTGLIKQLYDHHKEKYKLIVSGSSSIYSKSKSKQSLAGRAIDIKISGLSFAEYLDFRNKKIDFHTNVEILQEELKREFISYSVYGFYPQIILAEEIYVKELYIRNLIERYIYKDVREIGNIREIDKFNSLIKYLSAQCCSLINISEIAKNLKISAITVNEYLKILQDTYIINVLKPFHTNIQSELIKMPKIFFEDNGILNFLRFNSFTNAIDGISFENAVFSLLKKSFPSSDIKFRRTNTGQEVDFIIQEKNLKAVDAKLNAGGAKLKNLISFKSKYPDSEISVITLNPPKNKKEIKFLYPWQLTSL